MDYQWWSLGDLVSVSRLVSRPIFASLGLEGFTDLHNIRPAGCKAFLATSASFLNCKKCCNSSTLNKQLSFQLLFHATMKSPHQNQIDFCGPAANLCWWFVPSSFLSCAGLVLGLVSVSITTGLETLNIA